ncbi:hypothetical protein L5M38_20525 [Shewanella sp. SM101]|jgi:hypothetical protein|uniref:hypothetical protein n=1 Tax=Shewanella TaxID=22 RepID=UPI0021DA5337|nr:MULTISPECIES: hypothetical protein [unclassified Shewanella]MCU8008957.1 hypothetical protein [Shewanella sp. SM87]MCU8106908.1 hypothetical protein [Shewanella sp. SM101]
MTDEKTVKTPKPTQIRVPRTQTVRAQQPRKFISKNVQLKSNTVQQLFSNEVRQNNIKMSISRIAGLFVLTSNNKEVRDRLDTWFGAEQEEVARRCTLIEQVYSNETEGNYGANDDMTVITPDTFSVTFQVEHPIYWRVIDAITKTDAAISQIENLWLSGELSESMSNSTRGIAINTMQRFFGRLRTVATDSANRKGGIYSLEDYNKIMQALRVVSESNAEDEFSDTDGGITPDAEATKIAVGE